MGFFGAIGAIGSFFKKGWEWAKETVKSGVRKVKEVGTNLWNKFSGKDKFLEAEKLYDKITDKYNKRRAEFDRNVGDIGDKIEGHIEKINEYKEKIRKVLFLKMSENISKLKDINVDDSFTAEEYIAVVLKTDGVRSKDDLYSIDFNKHKFKTNVQAILSFGFYTRKKAKETLYAVQEEEAKINEEIEKMDAEIVKLQGIEEALENVEFYFENLIKIYEQLLVRLDNSVKYLSFRCLSFAHKIINDNLSIKFLPKMQQKEIESIITASKILKEMTDAKLISVEDKSLVESFKNNLKDCHDKAVNVYEVA